MATSQLGNGCKSKHEGDIKGLNDKGRGGKEILGVTTWRERWEDGIMGGVRRGCSGELKDLPLSAYRTHTFGKDAFVTHVSCSPCGLVLTFFFFSCMTC